VFHALARTQRPAYWVPGPGDAPIGAYVREASAIERIHPTLRGLHATAAFAPGGHVVLAGLGGEIDDHPDGQRDEDARLRYPRIEAEYRLKLLDELGEHERVLLFWSRPAHKRLDPGGSEAVAELVNTYRPRLVIVGGARGSEQLGTSLVVAPGSLCDGDYAVVDLRRGSVERVEGAPPLAAGPLRPI
jgi:Icc-related predicted phosphoesterase